MPESRGKRKLLSDGYRASALQDEELWRWTVVRLYYHCTICYKMVKMVNIMCTSPQWEKKTKKQPSDALLSIMDAYPYIHTLFIL